MTAYGIIEEDQGTFTTRRPHPHNGYYAGDFSTPAARTARSRMTPRVVRTVQHPSERMAA